MPPAESQPRGCFVGLTDFLDWLLTDKVTSWAGTPSDRGWRYLRQSLERHDSPDTDLRYSKVVFETIIGLERSSTPPPWLIHRLEVMIPLLCCSSRKSYCTCLEKRSMIQSGLSAHVCASSCLNWRWNLCWPLSTVCVSPLDVGLPCT